MEIDIPKINITYYEQLQFTLQYVLIIVSTILFFVSVAVSLYIYKTCKKKEKNTNEIEYVKMPEDVVATESKTLV